MATTRVRGSRSGSSSRRSAWTLPLRCAPASPHDGVNCTANTTSRYAKRHRVPVPHRSGRHGVAPAANQPTGAARSAGAHCGPAVVRDSAPLTRPQAPSASHRNGVPRPGPRLARSTQSGNRRRSRPRTARPERQRHIGRPLGLHARPGSNIASAACVRLDQHPPGDERSSDVSVLRGLTRRHSATISLHNSFASGAQPPDQDQVLYAFDRPPVDRSTTSHPTGCLRVDFLRW